METITRGLPKPLVPLVSGKSAIETLMDRLIDVGIVNEFVVCVGIGADQIMDRLGTSYRSVPILYSHEDRPLGTGGALINALNMIRSDYFLKLNSDTFFDVSLLRQYIEKPACQIAMTTSKTNQNSGFDGLSQFGNQTKLISRNENPECAIVGVYLLKKETLLGLPVVNISLEELLFEHLQTDISVVDLCCDYLDIGTVTGFKQHEQFLKQ